MNARRCGPAAGASAADGDAAPVSPRVLDAAIEWQLRLDSGEAGAAERAAFERWVEAHAEHGRAWRQLGALDGQLRPAQTAPARSALLHARPARGRRAAAPLLALVVVAILGVAALDRHVPLAALIADYGTATGERRRVELPDRSLVHLNTRTAVDLAFDAERRALRLRSGEILVETAHADAAEKRPFVVLTEHGALRALGTRFIVRKLEAGTLLTVTRSAVAARPAGRPDVRVVSEGLRALVRADGVDQPVPAAPDADAWKDGMLVVDNARLADVVAELARYRPGRLAVDARVAALRVTGSFALDDTDLALAALARALSLDVARHGRWWVTLAPRE